MSIHCPSCGASGNEYIGRYLADSRPIEPTQQAIIISWRHARHSRALMLVAATAAAAVGARSSGAAYSSGGLFEKRNAYALTA